MDKVWFVERSVMLFCDPSNMGLDVGTPFRLYLESLGHGWYDPFLHAEVDVTWTIPIGSPIHKTTRSHWPRGPY